MGPAIRFRSAVALIDSFPVLAGVDLDVEVGEIVLLEGANGAGKTSILRACAGLLRVVAGEARVLGEDITTHPRAVRRRVGLFGHATSLYEDLSVTENLTFALKASRTPTDRAEASLRRLGMDGRLRDTPVRSLSAGQRRRAALSILVARNPELWLLDEPHAGLDPEHRDLMDQLVTEAVSQGTTVVFASHELERALGLAHRSVSIKGGTAVDGRTSGAPGPEAPGSAATPDARDRDAASVPAPGVREVSDVA